MEPANGHAPPSAAAAGEDLPYALRISASWAWRLGIIIAVGGVLVWLLRAVSFLVIPIMVAALLAGLLTPVVRWLTRAGLPKGVAVAITELGGIAVVAGGLALVGRQLVTGFAALKDQAFQGLDSVQNWLSNGPLQLSTAEIDKYIQDAIDAVQKNSSSVLNGALTVGSTAGHFAAGLLIALFILIFFLLEGERIWEFLVGLMPRRARVATYGAGRRAWGSLVAYVRVQVLVAMVDAAGIGAGAAIIQVPLALPLTVLVFIGSFIPLVGALVTGAVAILLALVANGWVNALVMLGIVLLVQQAESHILQPLVMGRAVSLHPVAVILSVAAGSYLAGIPGALFSVPLLAVTNTFIRYIAARGWDSDPTIADYGPARIRTADGAAEPVPPAGLAAGDVPAPAPPAGRSPVSGAAGTTTPEGKETRP
jgi:predicted PurR-regulated permease PerM